MHKRDKSFLRQVPVEFSEPNSEMRRSSINAIDICYVGVELKTLIRHFGGSEALRIPICMQKNNAKRLTAFELEAVIR